ncbi:tyrosine-type recombinase/integrase [Pimelobacter simplex]|nr:site-specific integrase [Pimelobacter simplex]MCG8152580.1 tyrosine-type recombinase/integrase [Pimelobacter simplex]
MANLQRRENGKWRARYRDQTGKQIARHFGRKMDAQRWLDEVTTSVVTGQYVDPKAGQVTFRAYAETWRKAQVHRPSSAAHVETMLRRHAYPALGDRAMASILPSEIQAWVKRMSEGLAPSTVGVIHGIVSSVFKAAVRDRRIMANPCEGTKLPTVVRTKVKPLTTEQVDVLYDKVPDELKALVTYTAGVGPRQGEALALARDERLRLLGTNPMVKIDRQLVTTRNGKTEFGPLKTKASYRDVPLPKVVVVALNAHIATFDVGAGELLFTLNGQPITRQAFGHVWRPAAKAAGLDAETGTGMHALRHYYASLLIRHGESPKVVQARLGHATAAETLDTYSHLWPDSDDQTRAAIDSVLGTAARGFGDCVGTGDA